jgi:TatA/E family protein of Tat protein translocase
LSLNNVVALGGPEVGGKDDTMFGTQELLLILGAGILLFGAKKIPEMARGLGRSMNEFKKGMHDEEGKGDEEKKKDSKPKQDGAGDDSSADAGDVG